MEEGILISENKGAEVPYIDTVQRLRICRQCPLYLRDIEVCNPDLWMNPTTGKIAQSAKTGFIRGCGCLVVKKAKQPSSHCHLGRW